ncbi:MAG: NUDIX domain-containing protein [Bacilli bacterium]|nr:NUDIX domain-containing protein [Bacilli bacterium]
MKKNYISTLREKIGHEPIMSAGCGVLIINEKDEVLLEKRSDNGLFCLPGGAIELGENIEDGAKREVFEETGIKLDKIHLLAVYSGEKQKLIYPNGDVVYYIDFIYYAHVNSKDISIGKGDGESSEIAFYPKGKIPAKSSFLRGSYEPIKKYWSGDLEIKVD